jgi:tetratricopeptide (TPR) repeat protein
MSFFTKLFSKDDAQLLREAVALRERGDYKKALEIISQLIEKDPANESYLMERGHCHHGLGQYTLAEADFGAVIARGGETEETARLARGHARLLDERHEDALEDFHSVAESDSDTASEAWYVMGVVLQQLDRQEEAINCLLNATETGKGNPKAHYLLGCTFNQQGAYDRAVEHFSILLARTPEMADLWFNRGFAQVRLEQFAEALDDFDRMLELEPTAADALYYRGVCYHHLGRADEAIANLESAARANYADAQKSLDEWYPFEEKS